MDLEFRIALTHIGKGKIEAPGPTQPYNRYWSYARHLPADWDCGKIGKRTMAAQRLLENLELTGKGSEMDLSPLKDDQRASGFVYGENPLRSMYELISELSKRYPDLPFFGKWGGYEPTMIGKRFVFYVEGEREAAMLSERATGLASDMGVKIEMAHQYGITDYQRHVRIDARLRSEIHDRAGFAEMLQSLVGFPHFFHEFFE